MRDRGLHARPRWNQPCGYFLHVIWYTIDADNRIENWFLRQRGKCAFNFYITLARLVTINLLSRICITHKQDLGRKAIEKRSPKGIALVFIRSARTKGGITALQSWWTTSRKFWGFSHFSRKPSPHSASRVLYVMRNCSFDCLFSSWNVNDNSSVGT